MKPAIACVAAAAVLVVTLVSVSAQRVAVPRDPGVRGRVPAARAPRERQPAPETRRVATRRLTATAGAALRDADAAVTQRLQSGVLRLVRTDVDPALPSRIVERLQQYHDGVPVWGREVVRESVRGVAASVFGETIDGLTLDTRPRLTDGDASQRAALLAGADAAVLDIPDLLVLPLDGISRLAYRTVVSTPDGPVRIFLDAGTGAELLRYAEVQTQAAVGVGTGVLGDTKKISVFRQAGGYVLDDHLRPPVLTTFDLRDDFARALSVVDTGAPLQRSELGHDADNVWADRALVDAHVHIGWTYDYLFERFGRRGLDDGDRPIVAIANAASPQTWLALTTTQRSRWLLNAFWCGACGPSPRGVMVFGSGLPDGESIGGKHYAAFAGALDIVAHEMAHGIIDSSSRLLYLNESGALSESFADIIGTGVEFVHHPAGVGLRRADYVIAEDISRAVTGGARDGERSLADPALFGDPDHYSRRLLGPADNGGVHSNSGISNQAFYLAVEGGRNRTSGFTVAGVGAANREQVERVFYRAFVFLLPASATFSTARLATIQAARDLYGAGSAVERAVTDAWTAVGVL